MFLDKKEYVRVVLMDVPKVFDTINDELLIAKLRAHDFSKNVLKLLLSFIYDRWQKKKINSSFSS